MGEAVDAPVGDTVELGLTTWLPVLVTLAVSVGDAVDAPVGDAVELRLTTWLPVFVTLAVPVTAGVAVEDSVEAPLPVDVLLEDVAWVFVTDAVRDGVRDFDTLAVRVCDWVVSAVSDTPR